MKRYLQRLTWVFAMAVMASQALAMDDPAADKIEGEGGTLAANKKWLYQFAQPIFWGDDAISENRGLFNSECQE